MQYRRITEVMEEDNKFETPSGHPGSANAKILKGNPDRVHVSIGPKTPAEADMTDDDVTLFKRVHIVAGPDTRPPAADPLELPAGTDSESDIDAGRRPSLPAPTESSIGDLDDEVTYSIPADGSPITIRTSPIVPLPAPYHSIVNATGPGEQILTSIDGDASSRRVMVYKHGDGQMATMRLITEEEEAVYLKRDERRHVTLRRMSEEEVIRHVTLRRMSEEEVIRHNEARRSRQRRRKYDSVSSSTGISLMPSLHEDQEFPV